MASVVYLGLGTNVGDRLDNLRRAVHALRDTPGIRVRELSPVYETEPWGLTDQPDFLNMVVSARTEFSPRELLPHLKGIEQQLGREKTIRWGPRLIDVDILAVDEVVLQEEGLNIPHPGVKERVFVLAPLADIAPDWRHPRTGQTTLEMLANVEEEVLRRLPLPLEWGWRTHVMGILNVTPDSFSGDGLLQEEAWLDAAVAQAQAFAQDGADILDIGGESTRPGSTPLPLEEELARVLPVIKRVREVVDLPISVDTYRAEVAEAALEAGADWVNDVWGLHMDEKMAPLVAERGVPLVIMHNRSRPKDVEQEERLGGRYVGVEYDDLIEDIKREIMESVDLALSQGVEREAIIIDPGIGFGKTVSQNMEIIDRLREFEELGFPILIGPSRKSFIGYTLKLPPDERMEGTAATVAVGIDRGADIIRVHDVKEMWRVARMTDRIVRGR